MNNFNTSQKKTNPISPIFWIHSYPQANKNHFFSLLLIGRNRGSAFSGLAKGRSFKVSGGCIVLTSLFSTTWTYSSNFFHKHIHSMVPKMITIAYHIAPSSIRTSSPPIKITTPPNKAAAIKPFPIRKERTNDFFLWGKFRISEQLRQRISSTESIPT